MIRVVSSGSHEHQRLRPQNLMVRSKDIGRHSALTRPSLEQYPFRRWYLLFQYTVQRGCPFLLMDQNECPTPFPISEASQ